MKKCKIYLTEYEAYDPEYKQEIIYAGPTILAASKEEAQIELDRLIDYTLMSPYRIINA